MQDRVTIAELASRTGKGLSTLAKYIHDGRFKAVAKRGHNMLYDFDSAQEAIRQVPPRGKSQVKQMTLPVSNLEPRQAPAVVVMEKKATRIYSANYVAAIVTKSQKAAAAVFTQVMTEGAAEAEARGDFKSAYAITQQLVEIQSELISENKGSEND